MIHSMGMTLRSGRVLTADTGKNKTIQKYVKKTENTLDKIEEKIQSMDDSSGELNRIYEQVIELSKEIMEKANISDKSNWEEFSELLKKVEDIKDYIKNSQLRITDSLKEIENYYSNLDVTHYVNIEEEHDKIKENIGKLILLQFKFLKENNKEMYLVIDKLLKSLNAWEIFLANFV